MTRDDMISFDEWDITLSYKRIPHPGKTRPKFPSIPVIVRFDAVIGGFRGVSMTDFNFACTKSNNNFVHVKNNLRVITINDKKKIVVAFQGMHVSPAKHSYA